MPVYHPCMPIREPVDIEATPLNEDGQYARAIRITKVYVVIAVVVGRGDSGL